MLHILFQNPLQKLDSLGLCDPFNHIDQLLHLCVCHLLTLMGLALKFLQYMKFLNLHTLVIGTKLLEKLNERVKREKNPCTNNQTVATQV